MATIDLITYDQKLVTPKDDALIHQFGISNGILYGCEVTIANSNTLHITGGQGIIYGRQWEISEGDITVTLPASGSLRGRLYVKLNLSNTTNPIELLVQTAVTLPDLTDDDQVNVDNSVSELEICTFDVSSLTISNLVRTVSPVADGSHADVVDLQDQVDELNASLVNLKALSGNNSVSGYYSEQGNVVTVSGTAKYVSNTAITFSNLHIPNNDFPIMLREKQTGNLGIFFFSASTTTISYYNHTGTFTNNNTVQFSFSYIKATS